MNNSFKKVLLSGLTLAMVLGGSTAAFADGKGKGNNRNNDGNHDDDNERRSVQTKFDDKFLQTNYNGNTANLNIRVKFDDVHGADVEWAQRYIASLASKRVFEGFEDGTFQPRQKITRIDAITAAVRLMGLREQAESNQAMTANLNFKDADKLKANFPWATGYVSVALENDLFEESDNEIQPEKAADRIWATTLLVKALKLQNEAKAKMNAKLTFKDANQIPAGSVGYVALAIEKNLVNGYEDNTFRPNNPVTRAEMAALLDRTGSYLPPDNTVVRGTVNAVVNNNTLSLTVNGQQYNVVLDPNVFIFRTGTGNVPASDLKVGDSVLVNTANGKAIFINVLTPGTTQQTDFTVTGKLNTFTWNEADGVITSITLNQNGSVQTAVYNSNLKFDRAQLTVGRDLELRGYNQIVHTIIIR